MSWETLYKDVKELPDLVLASIWVKSGTIINFSTSSIIVIGEESYTGKWIIASEDHPGYVAYIPLKNSAN